MPRGVRLNPAESPEALIVLKDFDQLRAISDVITKLNEWKTAKTWSSTNLQAFLKRRGYIAHRSAVDAARSYVKDEQRRVVHHRSAQTAGNLKRKLDPDGNPRDFEKDWDMFVNKMGIQQESDGTNKTGNASAVGPLGSPRRPESESVFKCLPLGISNPAGSKLYWLPAVFSPLFNCVSFVTLVKKHLRNDDSVKHDCVGREVLALYNASKKVGDRTPISGINLAKALQQKGIIYNYQEVQNPRRVAFSLLRYLDRFAPPACFSQIMTNRFTGKVSCLRCDLTMSLSSDTVVDSWTVDNNNPGSGPITINELYSSSLIRESKQICPTCQRASTFRTAYSVVHNQVLVLNINQWDTEAAGGGRVLRTISVDEFLKDPFEAGRCWRLVAIVLFRGSPGHEDHMSTVVFAQDGVYLVDEDRVERLGNDLNSIRPDPAIQAPISHVVYERV